MDYPSIYDLDPAQAEELLMYGNGTTHYADPADGYALPDEDFDETYANAEYREAHVILADGGDRFGVSSLAFDPHEELVWMGNQGGHVTSYVGSSMQKYTSFAVSSEQNEVRHMLALPDGILILTRDTLRCQLRRGLPLFTHVSPSLQDMQCQLQISQDSILLGGHQQHMVQFNLTTGTETALFSVGDGGCAILRRTGRFVCAGSADGEVTLRDPNSLRVQHSVHTHSASLSDLDVHGNLLVTCGLSNRHGGLSVDRFLMAYDVRMMRAVAPIQVSLEPLLLRFLPAFSSRLALVSAHGQLQLLDTVVSSSPTLCLYQLNTGGTQCLSFDVSSSGQCLAFGDQGGNVHLYTTRETPQVNSFSRDTEFADPLEALPPLDMDDTTTPLAAIPLPHCTGPMLSDWPQQLVNKVYRRTPQIDPDILRSMKLQGTIGYAPNPNKALRNQVVYKLPRHDGDGPRSRGRVPVPRRYRKQDLRYSKAGAEDLDSEQHNKTSFSGLEATLPNSYCNPMLQVLYYLLPLKQLLASHSCPREFCLSCELGFLFHMLDSAQGFPCQPSNFLRAFRSVPEASALNLVLSDSPHDSKRHNITRLIQSWNRFILHQTHQEAVETSRWRKAGATQAFVFQERDFPRIGATDNRHREPPAPQAAAPAAGAAPVPADREESEVSALFGLPQTHIHRCLKCRHEVSKESTQLLCNLLYPDTKDANEKATEEVSFCSVLVKSICPETVTPAWCAQCDKFTPTLQSRRLKALPEVLALNCGLDSEPDKRFWAAQAALAVSGQAPGAPGQPPGQGKPCRYGSACARPGCRFQHAAPANDNARDAGGGSGGKGGQTGAGEPWLPLHLRIALLAEGGVMVDRLTEGINPPPQEGAIQSISYDLSAVVCFIGDEKNNLVAMVNVSPVYHQRAGSPVSHWYIFNDLTITPVSSAEASWFPLDWKVPCVLYFTSRRWTRESIVPSPPPPSPPDVFTEDECLARNARKLITFTPLAHDEMPGRGDIVAMDAEFVTLNAEEAELRSDGKMSTIKPSHMSVARITCIRGQGPREGEPFIDDYISTQEQVVDYVTKFSGIQPGDLDANFSSKHLTTLKATYRKLRFLLDRGVVFLGHGLKTDFRVINLVVPPEQVIDTVLLFHLPHNRMVSLRFLAWHFLDLKIQSVTHDSIEDARTALSLYQRYCTFQAQGCTKQRLQEMYSAGKRLQWKIPE